MFWHKSLYFFQRRQLNRKGIHYGRRLLDAVGWAAILPQMLASLGAVFALAGVVGAAIGAELGKAFDGQRLLTLFGLLMIGVGISMLRKRSTILAPDVRLTRTSARVLLPRLIPIGLLTGLAAGFFGIGGGWNAEEMKDHGTNYRRRWRAASRFGAASSVCHGPWCCRSRNARARTA